MATHGLPAWPWTSTPWEELPPPELVLLEAARAWQHALREGGSPMAAARLPLATMEVADSAPALDAVLLTVLRPGLLGCRICPRVTEGEAALLTALSLAQRAPRREALAAFLRLAPTGSAYAAVGPALRIGLEFRRAGLWMRHRLRV